MPTYKLTYFNIRALGEPVRLLFAVAKVPFENATLSFADWPKLKATTGHGQLPIMEEDGVEFTQTLAMCRYLAKKFNLMADTDLGNYRGEQMVELLSELRLIGVPFIVEEDPKKKEVMRKELLAEPFPRYFGHFNTLVGKTEGPCIAGGEKVTWADIFVATWVDIWKEILLPTNFLDAYPAVAKLHAKVFALQQIKDFYKK